MARKKIKLNASTIWLFFALALCLSIFMISHAMSRIVGHEWIQQTALHSPARKNGIFRENLKAAKGHTSPATIIDRSTLPLMISPAASTTINLSSTTVATRREAKRLSPQNLATSESVQLDEEIMIIVGGYIDSFKNVSKSIQFFNISSQNWMDRTVELPQGVGETHQGITFDPISRTLYIVSGQLGPGCMPATATVVRLHIDSEEWQFLPPLPLPRYAPGATIITDPNRSTVKHLHVFGGASSNRNDSATDHWRLTIDDMQTPPFSTNWASSEPLPDGGTHGASFVSLDGYIYYTGFCNLDPGMIDSPSMAECHRHAAQVSKQRLHHVSHAGLTYRYPTAFTKGRSAIIKASWERVADMPFPVCHGGTLFKNGKQYIIGGSILTLQTAKGSAPISWPIVQVLDPATNRWQASPKFVIPKRAHLFLMSSWIDEKRQKVYSLHPGNTLVTMDLVQTARSTGSSSLRDETSSSSHKTVLREYQQQTQRTAMNSFQNCLYEEEESDSIQSNNLTVYTTEDEGYEDLRGTWNKRNAGKQYPHAVVQPSSTAQVSKVIQCAKGTGYHVCGRNGRHSYDGSTCTNGIVVDVSKFNAVEFVDAQQGVVRLGAGLTLGQVVVELEKYGWALPTGTCSSVGITGLTLNGGQGPLSRLEGLTSDHLVAVELVDEKGNFVRATATNEFSDYLWLARGGGAVGYHYPGIITRLEFAKLVRIPRNETIWTRVRIRYTPATVDKAVKLLSAWQAFYQDEACQIDPMCNRITAEPWLFMQYQRRKKSYEPALRLVVYFFGNEEQHQLFVTDYLPKFQGFARGGIVASIERQDQLEFHRKVGGLGTVDQLSVPYLGHDVNTSWFGLSAVAGDGGGGPMGTMAPQETFRSIAESVFLREPKYRRYAEFKPLGGAIRSSSTNKNKTNDDASAFWHRHAHWWVLMNHFLDTAPEDSSNNNNTKTLEEAILHDFDGTVASMGDSFQGQYAGYVRHGNSTARDLELYYGRHADRIREIKRTRDPHNLFRNYLPNNVF